MAKKKTPVITAAWLKEHGACVQQVDIFEALWPKGARITIANIRRAMKNGLEIEWLVGALPCNAAGNAAYLAFDAAAMSLWQAWQNRTDAGVLSWEDYYEKLAQLTVETLLKCWPFE